MKYSPTLEPLARLSCRIETADIEAMLDACAQDGYRERDLVHVLLQSPIFLGHQKP